MIEKMPPLMDEILDALAAFAKSLPFDLTAIGSGCGVPVERRPASDPGLAFEVGVLELRLLGSEYSQI